MKKAEKASQFFDTEGLKADLKGRSVRGGAVTMAAELAGRGMVRLLRERPPAYNQSGAWTPSNVCDEALACLEMGGERSRLVL